MEVEVVGVPRRLIVMEEVAVGVWLFRGVTEGVAEMVVVRVPGNERIGLEEMRGEALLALQRVGVGEDEGVLEVLEEAVTDLVRRIVGLLDADPVDVFVIVTVRVCVPDAVCVRVRGGLRVGDGLAVDVLDVEVLAVEVGVRRILRDCGAERVKEGLLEGVLEGRMEAVKVGLAEEVLEGAMLRVSVGDAEEVLETAGEVVDVFEMVAVLVAVAVEVVVRVGRWDAVDAEEAVVVLEIAPDFVPMRVGGTDLVEVVLGDGRRDAAEENVEVVVFVDVFESVLVAVGTMPNSRRPAMICVEFHGDAATLPIAARSKSQRILSTTGWRGYLRQEVYYPLIGWPSRLSYRSSLAKRNCDGPICVVDNSTWQPIGLWIETRSCYTRL
jgi:hypothetical protein